MNTRDSNSSTEATASTKMSIPDSVIHFDDNLSPHEMLEKEIVANRNIMISSGSSGSPYTLSLYSNVASKTLEEALNLPDLSCHSIRCFNVLEYEDINEVMSLIGKLKPGGTLIINGVEAMDVTGKLARGEITVEDASSLLCQGRVRMNSCKSITDNLTQLGLTLTFAGITSSHYLIEATK